MNLTFQQQMWEARSAHCHKNSQTLFRFQIQQYFQSLCPRGSAKGSQASASSNAMGTTRPLATALLLISDGPASRERFNKGTPPVLVPFIKSIGISNSLE